MRPTAVFVSCAGDGYLGGAVARAAGSSPDVWRVTGSALSGTGVRTWAPCGSPAALRAALAADVVVLDLLGAPAEAGGVLDAVQAELLAAAADPTAAALPSRRRRTIIGLSGVLTWDGGADRDGAAATPEAHLTEAGFEARATPTGAAPLRQLEEQLLGLDRSRPQLQQQQRVRTVLVACGLPYGHGHGPLAALLQRARGTLADGAPLPVPCLRRADGANAVPAIHVDDAARFVCKLAAAAAAGGGGGDDGDPSPPLQRVYVAVDAGSSGSGSATTLASLATAVACSVGSGATTPVTSPAGVVTAYPAGAAAAAATASLCGLQACGAAAPDPSLESALLPLTQVDVSFDVDSLAIHGGGGSSSGSGDTPAQPTGRAPVALAPDEWRCRNGPAHPSSLALLRNEFASATGVLLPTRVCVTGPPAAGKSTVAAHIAAARGLPLVSLASAVDAFTRAGADGGAADGGAAGVVRALGDGTPTRAACLRALWDAVAKYGAEAEAAVAAQQQAQATASGKAALSGAGAKAAAAKATTTTSGGGKAAATDAASTPSAAGGPPASPSQPPAAAKPPRLPLVLLARVVRAVLTAPAYRATGWVLDGAPRTGAEAAALFGAVAQSSPLPAAPVGVGGDDALNADAGSSGGGAPTLEDPDGLMPPAAVMAALGLPLAPYTAAYVAARDGGHAGGGFRGGNSSASAPASGAAVVPTGGATTTKPAGAKKAGDMPATATATAAAAAAAAAAAGAGKKDAAAAAKAAAAAAQSAAPKVDSAFIATCLAEEADADAAALADADAAGVTITVMGSAVKPPAPAAAPVPPTSKPGDKAVAAAVPAPQVAPSSLPTPVAAICHHLAPHLVLVLDAVHDVALHQRLPTPPLAQVTDGGSVPPPDAAAAAAAAASGVERFLRKLRRYRVHNAAGSNRSVAAWAEGVAARDAAADGFRASLTTCVGSPAVASLNVNATTGDGLLRAAGMLVTDARLAAMRRARAAAPVLLAGVRLPEEEGEAEGAGKGAAAATGIDAPPAAGGEPSPPPATAVQRLEARHLDERTAPARAALMQALLPHISDGLVRVCAADPPPTNPVLALARYLQGVADGQKQRAAACGGKAGEK